MNIVVDVIAHCENCGGILFVSESWTEGKTVKVLVVPCEKCAEFKWICEFCFRTSNESQLPASWDWVWQSAVCPQCQRLVALEGGYGVVKGGAYAYGKPDPRSKTG